MTRNGPPTDIDRPETAPPPPPNKRQHGYVDLDYRTGETALLLIDRLLTRIERLEEHLDRSTHVAAIAEQALQRVKELEGNSADESRQQDDRLDNPERHNVEMLRYVRCMGKRIDNLSNLVAALGNEVHDKWQQAPDPTMFARLSQRIANLESQRC